MQNLLKFRFLFPLSIFIIGFLFIFSNTILPTHQDDTIYFNSARQYIENCSTYGGTAINFEFSKFGEHNWYGPGYHIFYGSISSIFGFNQGKTILYFQLFLWTIILYLIGKRFRLNTIFLLVIITLSPISLFLTSFYPVILNVSLSVLCFLIISEINHEQPNKSKKLIILFIIIVLFGAFIRITNIFNFVLLFALTKSFKNLFFLFGIFLSLIGLTWMYQTYYCAPLYFSGDDKVNLIFDNNLISFIKTTFINLWENVSYYTSNYFEIDPNYWISFIGIIFTPLFVSKSYFTQNKSLFLSILLLNLLVLSTLFTFYVPKAIYIDKQLLPLLPINYCLLTNHTRFSIKLYLIPFFLGVLNIPNIGSKFQNQLKSSEIINNHIEANKQISSIKNLIFYHTSLQDSLKDKIDVVIDQKQFWKNNENMLCAFFCEQPYKNEKGNNIRYISVIGQRQKPANVFDPKGDFILSLNPIADTGIINLVAYQNNIFLYRVIH